MLNVKGFLLIFNHLVKKLTLAYKLWYSIVIMFYLLLCMAMAAAAALAVMNVVYYRIKAVPRNRYDVIPAGRR